MIHVYFHRDADGVCSALLHAAGRSVGDDEMFLSINYGEECIVIDNMNAHNPSKIIFLDFAPTNETIVSILDANIVCVTYDHHKGTFERMARLYSDGTKNADAKLDIVNIEGESTTSHLLRTIGYNLNWRLSSFFRLIGRRDSGDAWDTDVPAHERISMKLAHHVFMNDLIFRRMLYDKGPFTLREVKHFLNEINNYNMDTLYNRSLLNYAKEVDKLSFFQCDIRDSVVFCDASEEADIDISELGNLKSIEHQMPCVIKTRHQGRFSVRSNAMCEVSALDIASKYGGAGHKFASGFESEELYTDASKIR